MERGCNGQVAADFGKLVDELNDIVFGRPAMLPRCMTGHAHLGVHSTVPVQMQARLGWLLSRVDHNLMQHRAHNKPGQDIRYLSAEITGSYPAETSSKSHSCCAETGKRA